MYKINPTAPAVVLSIVISFSAASPSFGSQITYTEQVTASGVFNGSLFTDADVLLTMNNNTTNVSTVDSDIFINSGTATVSIDGGTPFTFINPILVFSDQSLSVGGFSDSGENEDILDIVSDSFATYDLKTSIGPLVGVGGVTGNSFPTTGGAFEPFLAGDVTFTATTTGVPEGSTWMMMLLGFAGLAYAGWRAPSKNG